MICNEWLDHAPIPLKRHWWSRQVSLHCVRCDQEIGVAGNHAEAVQEIYDLAMERLYLVGLEGSRFARQIPPQNPR